MVWKSLSLDFNIIYKADVTVSKVLFVSTIFWSFKHYEHLCWLRKFNLSSFMFKIPSLGLFWNLTCFSEFLSKLPETDIFFIVLYYFFLLTTIFLKIPMYLLTRMTWWYLCISLALDPYSLFVVCFYAYLIIYCFHFQGCDHKIMFLSYKSIPYQFFKKIYFKAALSVASHPIILLNWEVMILMSV